jgi:hypothetical protein
MSGIFIYQIFYTKSKELDPGFLALDNSTNARPDWFEYWPIRKFLLSELLDQDSFYGFLSPRFKEKTNLSAAAAHEFVEQQSSTADVILLSPSLHLTAYHWNVFKYGDSTHPGLLKVSEQFFARINQPTNLEHLVTTSSNEVYSNFFIARPRFWKVWLNITEQLFSIAESPSDPLGIELRKTTSYRGRHNTPMKVFILERIATWILATDPRFVAVVRNPFAARSRIYKLPAAIVCDALKVAYLAGGRKEAYKDLFQFFSKFGKFLSWQIRLGSFLGIRQVRSCLNALSCYWTKNGQS